MKTVFLTFLLILFVCLSGFAEQDQTQSAAPGGKKIFLDSKCNMCHSLKSQEIQTTAGKYITSEEPNAPVDLSGVGSRHTADWFGKYLKKKEARNGVNHVKTFRGTDEELSALAKWLEGLKK